MNCLMIDNHLASDLEITQSNEQNNRCRHVYPALFNLKMIY